MGIPESESEAEHNGWCMCVFVSVNTTSLFIRHWTLFMQGLVRPNLEELFPCLKPRITSWPAGNRGQLKAAALGSYTTSRTLKELSLIRRKPVCTLKEVCETCMSLLVVQLVSHVWLFVTLRVNCSMPGLSVHHCLPEFGSQKILPKPCPLSWWCHPVISSSAVPFSSCA